MITLVKIIKVSAALLLYCALQLLVMFFLNSWSYGQSPVRMYTPAASVMLQSDNHNPADFANRNSGVSFSYNLKSVA